MKMTVLTVLLLSGCTPDRQNITWSFDSSATPRQHDQVALGFFAWYDGCRGLSFYEGEPTGWATHVNVHFSEGLPQDGAVGITDPGWPWEVSDEFDITLWRDYRDIPALAAHELGHVMANTPDHVPYSGHVMSLAVKERRHPSNIDLEWMAEHGQDCGE